MANIPNIETLVKDIQKLFDGADLSERMHHLTKNMGDAFVSKFLEYAEERNPSLRMSNIGKPLRQLWYDLKGFKGEPLSAEAKFKFLYGNIIEELVLFLAQEAGHEVTDLQREVDIDGVKGHCDAVIDGVLVDAKSCSTRSFDKFVDGSILTDDPFGYIAQLTGYATALGIDRAGFLAIDKQLGRITFCEIDVTKYDVKRKIRQVREVVKLDTPPERCYEPVPDGKSGNLRLGTSCSYCSHKFTCWADANNGEGIRVFSYSTGPRFLVKVAKSPKVDEFPIKQ